MASVAAAVALIFALRAPAPVASLPEELRSRPADGIVGRIEPALAGAATARVDLVYADRLAGYRQLLLRPRTRRP